MNAFALPCCLPTNYMGSTYLRTGLGNAFNLGLRRVPQLARGVLVVSAPALVAAPLISSFPPEPQTSAVELSWRALCWGLLMLWLVRANKRQN